MRCRCPCLCWPAPPRTAPISCRSGHGPTRRRRPDGAESGRASRFDGGKGAAAAAAREAQGHEVLDHLLAQTHFDSRTGRKTRSASRKVTLLDSHLLAASRERLWQSFDGSSVRRGDPRSYVGPIPREEETSTGPPGDGGYGRLRSLDATAAAGVSQQVDSADGVAGPGRAGALEDHGLVVVVQPGAADQHGAATRREDRVGWLA